MSVTKKKSIRKVKKRALAGSSNTVIVTHAVMSVKETSKLKKINQMLENAKLRDQ
jgi:hypothetical protein